MAGPLTAVLVVVLALAWLDPGTALATARNSVSATGPRTAQAGQSVRLHFRGFATRRVPLLRVWLDDQACATSAQSESGRSGLPKPTDFRVRRRFRAGLTVMHTSKGTHVACAYLLYRGTHNTAARASWRYVTS